MVDTCQYLEYRRKSDGKQFDVERAYCTVIGQFVQPMRADICNYRYSLKPEEHCEHYAAAQSSEEDQASEPNQR